MLKYSATLESAKEYAQKKKLDAWIQLYEKVWRICPGLCSYQKITGLPKDGKNERNKNCCKGQYVSKV